ncbi:MAG: 2-succinyl-5-enolpyruvyl-6-hydroxy-3-cyclohexene-1-carboxylic-acid synthase [candidate division Zixibacteria bacterium]|nr:2-succinyl-5-enolpyruvyl-6-hydroxy-3-cyclohexene-1-carboxylic-acid synthase [candidate division Zixibacteria bacterium]
MINTNNINMLWCSLIIEELYRSGAEYFVISPGSRSTPLTAAAAYHEEVVKKIHFDERGAAFYALGYARATGRPAVLICTSGTAPANYLPAVVEASNDLLPLILLTADRPPELRDTGANQTVIQPGIFSHFVRWEFDLPCPNENIKPELVLTTIDQAMAKTLGSPSGPVHLNCPFREPLAPDKTEQDFSDYLKSLERWRNSERPYTSYSRTSTAAGEKSLSRLTMILNQTGKGVLIAGRLKNRDESEAVITLSEKLGWPVFPDILSGLRLGADRHYIVNYYDRLLLSKKFHDRFQPETILHIGDRITSKKLLQFIENNSVENYIHITYHAERLDPAHKVSFRLQSDIKGLIQKILPSLSAQPEEGWPALFVGGNKLINEYFEQTLGNETGLYEPVVARLISKHISSESLLFISSSLPIRDMDMFASFSGPRIITAANRGASGIDGTVAAASGFAAGWRKPVTLLIGDLTLLHDLNSLALLKDSPVPVTVVVVNNHGGNLFSFLPIARHKDIFEKYFTTPHDLSFRAAAALFSLDYYQPGDVNTFIDHYRQAQHSGQPSLIEIDIDREKSRNFYHTINETITNRLDELYG